MNMDHEACAFAALDALLCGLEWTPRSIQERIRDLYRTNITAGWAKSQISILAGMAEDRKDKQEIISTVFVADELRRILAGMDTVAELEIERGQRRCREVER